MTFLHLQALKTRIPKAPGLRIWIFLNESIEIKLNCQVQINLRKYPEWSMSRTIILKIYADLYNYFRDDNDFFLLQSSQNLVYHNVPDNVPRQCILNFLFFLFFLFSNLTQENSWNNDVKSCTHDVTWWCNNDDPFMHASSLQLISRMCTNCFYVLFSQGEAGEQLRPWSIIFHLTNLSVCC